MTFNNYPIYEQNKKFKNLQTDYESTLKTIINKGKIQPKGEVWMVF
jgi:hypothetical protein